jgi:two-component system, OmpR family, sensor histidine kinase BaeS
MRNLSLRVKLLIAFVAVGLAGIVSLIVAAELAAGGFYEAHIHDMTVRYGSGAMDAMHSELRDGFSRSLTQSLLVGLVVGIPLAVIVGFCVARRVIEPVERVSSAARRIAAGAYSERLPHGDRDELGLLIEDFNRMAASLETVEARRIELIGTVAHELRTPLAGLQGYAEGLHDGLVDREQAALAIEREVSRLKRLVNDLAEVSKVESGAVTLHLERFDLVVLVREVIERYELMFLEQQNELRVTLPDQAFANADRDRVTQILINLLANALKHAPGSRVELNIQARVNQTQESQIVLEVRDSGPGIPAEHLPHLFERFYRVDASRSSDTGGSGVGLTVSKHLATAMGGRLEVESDFGTGSRFLLTLLAA